MASMPPPVEADVVIIGAGPAGLAAAAACGDAKKTFMILDAGPSLHSRDRQSAELITCGVGGAGLYSDGKFSFSPSATRLWTLPDGQLVRAAYAWFRNLVGSLGLAAPPFPEPQATATAVPAACSAGMSVKRYLSTYMPLPERLALIDRLARGAAERLTTATAVLNCSLQGERWLCNLLLGRREQRQVVCRSVVFAAGRFGPVAFPQIFPGVPMAFRHVEVGLRIEQPSASFFLSQEPQRDPKVLLDGPTAGASARTFCCCRDGEIVMTCTSGLWSVSGRADGPASGFSNVGLNLRISDLGAAKEVWDDLLPRLSRKPEGPASEPLEQFHSVASGSKGDSNLVALLGVAPSRMLSSAITQLKDVYPSLRADGSSAWGPAVEGVGHYPSIDEDLRVGEIPLWVAGDSSGVFRGLTAPLVSGYYAGMKAACLGG
ncbi:MAG TPA: FAD-binding protein, partial [Tepidisphaeraceae bacterium]|nr:FAD-binding protein [Tepidisphaeraceae bacterium]